VEAGQMFEHACFGTMMEHKKIQIRGEAEHQQERILHAEPLSSDQAA